MTVPIEFPSLPAYILAGGKSSRFGTDKAMAHFAGQPLIQRIADSVRPFVTRVTVIAERKDKYAHLGLRTIADIEPDLGPLGGLSTAMRDGAQDEWLLLLSCDLLAVRPTWVETLLRHRTPTAQAVAFKPDFWQPLLALYKVSAQPVVRSRLASADRSMHALLTELGAVKAPLPRDWPALLQANRPQDLPRLQEEQPQSDG